MDTSAKLQAVRDLMDEMHATYGLLGGNPADLALKKKIEEWASKIAGVSLGYAAEFRTYRKHYMGKKRTVFLGHADLTIGKDSDDFSKSIQFKSTNQKNTYAVTHMMQVAANQLTGERGETPRTHDRRIVDMTISDGENPWPFPWVQSTVPDFNKYQDNARSIIKDILSSYGYIKHNTLKTVTRAKKKKVIAVDGVGIDDSTRKWMKDVSSFGSATKIRNMGAVDGTRSTVPIYETTTDRYIPHAISFKIRYTEGYPITYEGNQVSLELVVFHAMRSGSEIVVMLSKVVYDGGKTDHYFGTYGV